MTLRDILDQLDQQKADMIGCMVSELPRDEQTWRSFSESILKLEATLTWFDEPQGDEIGEIRIPSHGWRYGILPPRLEGVAEVRAEIELNRLYHFSSGL